jgi:hypothetical protein
MNCFNHTGVPALGICKHCGKGICTDCLADLGFGIACKGKCEDRVMKTNKMVENSLANYEGNQKAVLRARGTILRSGLFNIVIGLVFVSFGLYTTNLELKYFIGSLGVIYFIWGISTLLKGRR